MDRDDPLESRRHFLRKLLATSGVAVTGSLLAPLVHAFGKVPHQLPPGTSIYDMQGKVMVDGKVASASTRITEKSFVQTSTNSYVIFAVGQDAHILRENSHLQLEGAEGLADAMRLLTGKVLSVFGQRTGGKRLAIRTTTATIGIRGTGVYSESMPDASYVCTCYGHTEINSDVDPSHFENVVSHHHDAPRYILANPEGGKLIIPAPMKNHTDEELMLVETLVGRTPPFSAAGGYDTPRRGY
ncbi:MAG TPA: twin-arginine translocation signal domain-containing protein [Moraxellaceae bacterium]|nr:twin-arginine translocation signal domain-containing protein [Moraxellaceae bacterium]